MGTIKRFWLAIWSAPRFWRYVAVATIAFAVSTVGAKARVLLNVFVTNSSSNPVPVREQNTDVNGNIKVHEQDSPALHPFRAVICSCLSSNCGDQFTVPSGERLVIQEVTGTTLGPPGGGNLLPNQTDFRLTDTSFSGPFGILREYDFASNGGYFNSGANTTFYNMSAPTTIYVDGGATVKGSDPQQLEWYMTITGYLIP
jgi:hypothetical protein